MNNNYRPDDIVGQKVILVLVNFVNFVLIISIILIIEKKTMNKKSIFQIFNYLLFLSKFTYFYFYFQDSQDLVLFLYLELLLLISYVISYNFYYENVFIAITKFNQNYNEIIKLPK